MLTLLAVPGSTLGHDNLSNEEWTWLIVPPRILSCSALSLHQSPPPSLSLTPPLWSDPTSCAVDGAVVIKLSINKSLLLSLIYLSHSLFSIVSSQQNGHSFLCVLYIFFKFSLSNWLKITKPKNHIILQQLLHMFFSSLFYNLLEKYWIMKVLQISLLDELMIICHDWSHQMYLPSRSRRCERMNVSS